MSLERLSWTGNPCENCHPKRRFAQAAEALGAPAPFFLAAQRAFIDAASLALPSAVKPLFLFEAPLEDFLVGVAAVPLARAQRALAAAAILARASEDIVRRPLPRPVERFARAGAVLVGDARVPRRESNFSCSVSICSRRRKA